MTDSQTAQPKPEAVPWARRYLRILLGVILGSALLVAVVNSAAYSLMMVPEYRVIAQLRGGYGRTYKPMIQDFVKPSIVVFGASFARDAFDPDDLQRLTGRSAVNHAVSQGHPYESRRFLQSALAGNPELQTVILNVDSFLQTPNMARFEYGFDESILNVDARGRDNPFARFHRVYSRTLSGAAIGSNLELISILFRLRAGATKEEVVPCYTRRDWKQSPAGKPRASLTAADIDEALAQPAPAPNAEAYSELALALDAIQEHGIEAHLYFTPFPVDLSTSRISTKLATLEFVRERARKVPGRLTLFDFDYPNAVTLECRAQAGPSEYYRPDGHPRPTVGQLISSRIFAKPFPSWASPELRSDFGVELLSHPDAKGWLVTQARRRVELNAPR